MNAAQIRIDSKKIDYGLVSIIMPNYNSEKYIKQTINSVILQTYTNWELIFVDDCSTDNSLDIVKSFDDKRIVILQNDINSGAAITRNIAIQRAQGRWIAFLDSDDIWYSDKLLKQLTFMIENDCAFSFCSYEVINDTGEKLFEFEHEQDTYSYKDILKHNHIGCLTAVYDAEKFGKVLMPIEAEKREDHACWLLILKNGTNANCLHECLAQYRIHPNSVSSNKLKMVKYQWNVYYNIENLSLISSLYYIINWAIRGFLKYR